VEFALVAPLAVAIALAVAQFALFLFERNVVMGSLSEGARVAASSGRTVVDGERAARNLMRDSLGGRLAVTVAVQGDVEGGIVALRAEGTLPSFVPGVPGLRVHLGATMHKEEELTAPTAEGRAWGLDPGAFESATAAIGPGAELVDQDSAVRLAGSDVTAVRVPVLGPPPDRPRRGDR
jgi:hypothetical protein